jgi:nicotinamidase-related amidase
MDKTALLLVDIQNDYFPGGKMTLEGVDAASVNASRLLSRFREKRLPVFHIRHLATRPGATFFLPGTAGSEIHPSVAPRVDETVIVKHFPS